MTPHQGNGSGQAIEVVPVTVNIPVLKNLVLGCVHSGPSSLESAPFRHPYLSCNQGL